MQFPAAEPLLNRTRLRLRFPCPRHTEAIQKRASRTLTGSDPPATKDCRSRSRSHNCERESQVSCRQLTEKFTQSCCRLELRNWIELLKSAGEWVRQAPHRSRRKLRIVWLEVAAMHFGQQALGGVEFAVNKCRVKDQLRLGIGDLCLAPRLDLALHRLEVPLDAVHPD
jgi:hypothetical protein